jgi:hypothetical protein
LVQLTVVSGMQVGCKSRSSMARRSNRIPANATARSGVSAKPRNFNLMSVPGLSDEARQAVNAAFDAMSAWRIDTAKSNEKNSEQLIEKMAEAARALGWPGANRGWNPRAASEHYENADPNDGMT